MAVQVRECYKDGIKRILTVEPLVHVHCAMEEVLPGVHEEDGKEKLNRRNEVPVYRTRCEELPARKRGCNERLARLIERLLCDLRVLSSCDCCCKGRKRRELARQACSIDTDEHEQLWNCALCHAYPTSPDCNLVVLPASVFGFIEIGHEQTKGGLDDVLQDDVADDLPAGDMISFEEFLWRVQAIL